MNDQLKAETQSRALAVIAAMIEDIYRDEADAESVAVLRARMAHVVEEFKRAAALVSAID